MDEQKAKLFIERLRNDPLYYVRTVLGHELWLKQQEIIESVRDNKETSVRSCNGAGKSFVSADVVLWFLSTFKNSIVLTTAPTFRQVEDILWREIRRTYKNAKYDLGGVILKTSLNINDKWYAVGLSTDEPDRFQGYHEEYILIVVDEAAGVAEPIFEAADGNLTSEHSRLLLIGNPTNTAGTFYSSHKSATFNKIQISAFDTPNFTTFGINVDDIRNNTWKEKVTGPLPAPFLVTPEWVYSKFLKWGEGTPMWDARIMGNFPEQGEDTLIPLIKIEEAVRRELIPNEDDQEQTGADIARFGVDKTIFINRKGPKVTDIHEHGFMDTMATAQVLHVFLGIHPYSSLKADEIGVGAGVVDRIKVLDIYRDIEGINVGLPSNDPEMFFNLRAEIYWGLRQRFIDGDIDLPDDDELMSQLANIKYKFTPKGQIQIESKEEIKKRGLPSPDKADALALAFMKGTNKPNLLDYMKQMTQ